MLKLPKRFVLSLNLDTIYHQKIYNISKGFNSTAITDFRLAIETGIRISSLRACVRAFALGLHAN